MLTGNLTFQWKRPTMQHQLGKIGMKDCSIKTETTTKRMRRDIWIQLVLKTIFLQLLGTNHYQPTSHISMNFEFMMSSQPSIWFCPWITKLWWNQEKISCKCQMSRLVKWVNFICYWQLYRRQKQNQVSCVLSFLGGKRARFKNTEKASTTDTD